MDKPKIIVVGSTNTDMIIKSDQLPKPGETVLGGAFQMEPGGKGANQAVAAAKLGGEVHFISRVGKDWLAKMMKDQLAAVGIPATSLIEDDSLPSGVALILVDKAGNNSISVASGANAALSPGDIDQSSTLFKDATYLLTQLETPLETVIKSTAMARENGVQVILNPAPAQDLPASLLRDLHYITPNQTEAETLTGIPVSDVASARSAALVLREKGVDTVIITLGADGAYVLSATTDLHVPGFPQQTVVDTTGAGDVFNGALTVGLAEGMELPEAVSFANRSASWSVTKMGAQASAPSRVALTHN